MFKSILLLSNLGSDTWSAEFRGGAYRNTLFPLAARLAQDLPQADIRVAAAEAVWPSITKAAQEAGLDPAARISFTGARDGRDQLFSDGMAERIMRDDLSDSESNAIAAAYEDMLGGFVPDLIIAWEFPTGPLRALFPQAVVIDLMPGIAMRAPYPRQIAVDPTGIYRQSALPALLS
ncbi:MAG: hypothetical protein ACPGNV_01990, partial [Mangrovicoccus sp.]